MPSRAGRLICVDFADFLAMWRPGRAADLYAIPLARGFACGSKQALRELPSLFSGGACGITLGFHVHPRTTLASIDRFASWCRELLPTLTEDFLSTDTDRFDGKTGSSDVLVVRGEGGTGS